jgi:hypothetical protein
MHIPFYRSSAALLVALASAHAAADTGFFDGYRQAAQNGKTSYALEIDNDSLLLNGNDSFFTSGIRYSQRHTVSNGRSLTSYGWRIGQDLYTASDIKLPPEQVGPPDHPYAGWLYGGMFKETYRDDGTRMRWGVDVGCLGPCAGGYWTQTNLHRLLNQPLPQGWSRQVRNEAGVVLYGDLAPVHWALQQWLDATPYISARFGNIFTDTSAGLTLRAGRLNALPEQATLHVFARAEARAVAYNATLQGGYFSSDNPHTVNPKRGVGEIEGGISWRDGPYAITASVVRRGNEIRGLSNSLGAQNFVHLLFSYTP